MTLPAADLEALRAASKKLRAQRDELERRNRALEREIEQLALASRNKSEFLARTSHELRTPLNSLLILAKLLVQNEEGTLSERQLAYARTIRTAGCDLLELINDVLDLSKVEAGKLSVHVTDVRPAEVARFLEGTFRPLADEQGLRLEIEIDVEAPEAIATDGQRLEQVLKNLLANALAFTERGGVTLRIACAPAGAHAAGPVVEFRVADTGVGIPEDELTEIFEAFHRAGGTTSCRAGGTGLGLSISRELARLLGGEIRVESEVGRGSTFTLALPAAAPAAP